MDRLTTTSRFVDTEPGQQASHRAYLLLDDAFRQFFAERGAKVVSVEAISRLFTGSNRLRLAAYTLATLPVPAPDPGLAEVESVAVAEAVLRDSYASSHRWYQEFADMLADRRTSLDLPLPHRDVLHHVLGRRSRTSARSNGPTVCTRRCRCCGRMSSSRTRARCRQTSSLRRISSSSAGTGGC